MKTAVCLLFPGDCIRNGLVPGDLYLAVSRRKNAARFGLPGGKVDPGESDLGALLREVNEEVGLKGLETAVLPIYSGFCPGEVNYWVTTYLWVGRDVKLDELEAEEGLIIDWLNQEQLTNPGVSPFAGYNVGVFDAYSLWKRHAAA